MRLRVVLASAVLALPLSVGALCQTPLCERLRALTGDSTVTSAHWGVSVTTLDGSSLCGINEAQLFRPASNNKIFTTATALALLGKDHTITTRLEAEGQIKGGTLQGDLIVIGSGDANFGSHNIPYLTPAKRPRPSTPEPSTIADIEAFADQVVALGIHAVKGNIVGDDTYLAWQPYPPDWDIDDMVYGYGAPVSALTIHDNAIDFSVSANPPTTQGAARATIIAVPDVPYYQVDSSAYSIASSGGCDDRLSYQRAVGSRTLKILGDIAPPGANAPGKSCHQSIAIQDPAEYAALALKLALERRGIQVTGAARARHYDPGLLGGVHTERPDRDLFLGRIFSNSPAAPIMCQAEAAQVAAYPGQPAPSKRTVVATHVSPTLLEDMTYTNKVSQNQHAELFLRTLGAAYTCDRSQRDGLHVIREYMLHAGLEPDDFVLYDGSGLSTHDLVTPRALTKFLSFAATQPWFPDWRGTLPEGGSDGTLGARFKNLQGGRIFAKTGTLGESRALSGYLTSPAGRTLIFSIMVDTHLPGTSADRTVMDRIVEAIAAQDQRDPDTKLQVRR